MKKKIRASERGFRLSVKMNVISEKLTRKTTRPVGNSETRKRRAMSHVSSISVCRIVVIISNDIHQHKLGEARIRNKKGAVKEAATSKRGGDRAVQGYLLRSKEQRMQQSAKTRSGDKTFLGVRELEDC